MNKESILTPDEIDSKINNLRMILDTSNNKTTQIIETLKKSSSNLGAQYYWIVFVLIYGGVYLFQ